MTTQLTAKELHKLAIDSVFDVQPGYAGIWRDTKYSVLIVTDGLNHSHPSDEPDRYEYICNVDEAKIAFQEIAERRTGPALCARAYFCPNAVLVEDDE
jgi:hypothetical protein